MIYILTGDIGVGKSNSLLKLIKGRTCVSGVISPRIAKDKRCFLDIETQKSFLMQANEINKNTIVVGRYQFLKSAFEKANAIILKSLNKNSGFIVIDEIGKLELKEEGLHASALVAIKKTINNDKLHLILVVRTGLLEEVIEKYSLYSYKLLSHKTIEKQLVF